MVHSKNKLFFLNAETCDRGSGKEAALAIDFRYLAVIVIDEQMKMICSTVRERAATMDESRFFPFTLLFLIIYNTGNCLGMKSSSSHPTMFQWDNVDCNANNSFLCVMTAIENTTTTTLSPTTAPPRKLVCPIGDNWKAYLDSNYCFWKTAYKTARLNWYQARQFCQGYGGDLATYSSSNEEDHGLEGAKGHYTGLWFGLKRGEDDEFRWVDGMNLNYTNWKYGEPNLRSNKYCASHAYDSARWELDYCGVRRWFICKAPKVEVPTLPEIKFEKTKCNFTTSSAYRSSWYLYNNHCYLVHNVRKYTWDLAQNFCQDNGAHLASVHSFNETDFILLAGTIDAYSKYWIGLSAKGLGSSFTWSDGTPLDFLYWRDDSAKKNSEVNSCVSFDQQRGFWTVTNCNLLLGVICKRGVNATYDFPTQEPTPVLPGNCEPGWYSLGNQCYKVFGKKLTQRQSWQNAQNRCENESASLASIHNKEQQNFLTDLILEVNDDAWIGLKYLVRVIHWTDETPVDYSNWDINKPSFYRNGCVKLVYGRHNLGKWNDINCNQNRPFICQKKKDPSLTNPSEDPFSCSNKTGWSRLGTSCFRIFEEKTQKMSWTAAQSKCRTYEADLAIFKNSAVAVFLSKRITQKDEFFWIGVREMEEGTYVSLTQAHSKRLTQTNWISGQPSKISTTMDNCVAMNSEGKWIVRSCRENLAFVCEWNSEPEQEIVVDESRVCPKYQGWIDIGLDMCIKTNTFYVSWNEAMRHCFQIGGALVTFHSPKELKVFIDYVNSNFHYFSVHIGLARQKDGSYMWVDYSPVDFEAWDPDDVPNALEDCVQLDMRSEKWRKVHCDYRRLSFFCSKSKLTDGRLNRLLLKDGRIS
ncbi:macrophage mannose receptor 1 [Nephila pilipes]|uniref:Macrophage mannose receptor 1 n=1 Tax=Nephila pilipes TaxID=299642 RepID=A0A8X6PT82_NEPPI|nr:macrophage mannose receptor 1 [Nephila pilipes]